MNALSGAIDAPRYCQRESQTSILLHISSLKTYANDMRDIFDRHSVNAVQKSSQIPSQRVHGTEGYSISKRVCFLLQLVKLGSGES